jgi:hypothetical protein
MAKFREPLMHDVFKAVTPGGLHQLLNGTREELRIEKRDN